MADRQRAKRRFRMDRRLFRSMERSPLIVRFNGGTSSRDAGISLSSTEPTFAEIVHGVRTMSIMFALSLSLFLLQPPADKQEPVKKSDDSLKAAKEPPTKPATEKADDKNDKKKDSEKSGRRRGGGGG